jgi:hypothetical protein|tara:strand:+ start:1266 stop:1676 length:411 start_codon:yes stop_codon:yes gene_type:complete
MEDEFYASIKLVSGEEIFGEVMPVEEGGRTVLVVSDPVEIETVNINGSAEGLRMMPWLRSIPKEGIIIIPMDKIITVVEAQEESEVVNYYQRFVMANLEGGSEKIKVTKKMGYVISVEKAREHLEKLYNNNKNKSE